MSEATKSVFVIKRESSITFWMRFRQRSISRPENFTIKRQLYVERCRGGGTLRSSAGERLCTSTGNEGERSMSNHRKAEIQRERKRESMCVFLWKTTGSQRENHRACQARLWQVVFEHRSKSKNGEKKYGIVIDVAIQSLSFFSPSPLA